MGHTAILIGAAALGIALICLFAGYLWGRSNVRSQIEDALDKVRVSADAREFALREQLDEKMLEVVNLRARADEVPLLREQLAQLQASHLQNSHGTHSRFELPESPLEITPEHSQTIESVAAVVEDPIQSFFHPNKQKSQPLSAIHDTPVETKRPLAARFPASFSSTFSVPAASPEVMKAKPDEPPKPVAIQPAKPASVQPAKLAAVQTAKPAAVQPAKLQPPLRATTPAVKPVPAVNNDDWDEFAKSLEALKNLQK
ncbi:hypothetical protein P8935_10145 [Telmatobacter sp. DSM 110680]|uniref:Uncharacterized protein n=1 Tax=Telmatobacter sp. DSM 110680 TaxID=3036704 RepID=A0AAU7DPF6_9BACT